MVHAEYLDYSNPALNEFWIYRQVGSGIQQEINSKS